MKKYKIILSFIFVVSLLCCTVLTVYASDDCPHANTTTTYVPLSGDSHRYSTTCDDCGDHIDSNTKGCSTSGTRIEYKSSTSTTHEEYLRCADCGNIKTIKQNVSCYYVINDGTVCACGNIEPGSSGGSSSGGASGGSSGGNYGDAPCEHTNTKRGYFSAGDSSHTIYNVCEDCGEKVSLINPGAPHTDDSGICADCGQCLHSEINITYEAVYPNSHWITKTCSNCTYVSKNISGCQNSDIKTVATPKTSTTHEAYLKCADCGNTMEYRASESCYYNDGVCVCGNTLCTHSWNAATCTTPKTCSVCGATEGEALGHGTTTTTYYTNGATAHRYETKCNVCEAVVSSGNGSCSSSGTKVIATPITKITHEAYLKCADCGNTKEYIASESCYYNDGVCVCGNTPCTHSWNAATCTTPKTCSICGTIEGAAAGHSWKLPTCTAARTCNTCGSTEGSALGHSWNAATCTVAKTCSVCGATEGEPLGHTYINDQCTVCGHIPYNDEYIFFLNSIGAEYSAYYGIYTGEFVYYPFSDGINTSGDMTIRLNGFVGFKNGLDYLYVLVNRTELIPIDVTYTDLSADKSNFVTMFTKWDTNTHINNAFFDFTLDLSAYEGQTISFRLYGRPKGTTEDIWLFLTDNITVTSNSNSCNHFSAVSGVCSNCGETVKCAHSDTSIKYINSGSYHSVYTYCNTCPTGLQFIGNQTCIFLDGSCLCGNTSCSHTETTTTYYTNGSTAHRYETKCTVCEAVVSSGNGSCASSTKKTEATPLTKITHEAYIKCADCGNTVEYRSSESCYYNKGVCVCGNTPCTHSWNAATCTIPKMCSICGVTEGEALGHGITTTTYYTNGSTAHRYETKCTVCEAVVSSGNGSCSSSRTKTVATPKTSTTHEAYLKCADCGNTKEYIANENCYFINGECICGNTNVSVDPVDPPEESGSEEESDITECKHEKSRVEVTPLGPGKDDLYFFCTSCGEPCNELLNFDCYYEEDGYCINCHRDSEGNYKAGYEPDEDPDEETTDPVDKPTNKPGIDISLDDIGLDLDFVSLLLPAALVLAIIAALAPSKKKSKKKKRRK